MPPKQPVRGPPNSLLRFAQQPPGREFSFRLPKARSRSQEAVTIRNEFEGHGFGKLIVGFALRAAVKDVPAFAQRIKSAVEPA